MKQRNINYMVILLFGIFVLGILFASKYTPGKNKLATICVSKKTKDTQEMTKLLAGFQGIKTVFVDPKSELITFRYDSSKLTLESIKEKLNEHGLETLDLKSVKIIKSEKNLSDKKTKLFKLDFSSSAK